jgi:hypothetical protein
MSPKTGFGNDHARDDDLKKVISLWHAVKIAIQPLLRRPAAMPLMVKWIPCTTFSSASPAR